MKQNNKPQVEDCESSKTDIDSPDKQQFDDENKKQKDCKPKKKEKTLSIKYV